VTIGLWRVNPGETKQKGRKEYGAPTGGSALFLFVIVTDATIGLSRDKRIQRCCGVFLTLGGFSKIGYCGFIGSYKAFYDF